MQNAPNEAESKTTKMVIMRALWSVFPSVKSFKDFKELDHEISRKTIPGIIQYAHKNGLILNKSEKDFIEFLSKNNDIAHEDTTIPDLTFSDVLDILAGNLSINALIQQIQITASDLSLPEIQASMITRLKKNFLVNTPKKRAILRTLAFKIAEKKPGLNLHYEKLLQLPVSSSYAAIASRETAGITITLHLQGQGEIIAPEDVSWLKSELNDCIKDLQISGQFNKKAIETIGATSFNLRYPKKPGNIDKPQLYNRMIWDMLAIAHQMSARWLLCRYSSPRKLLVIIIHAGLMSDANRFAQPFLETNVLGESGIYLSDFAYLCAGVADVRVEFERCNQRPNWPSGHPENIWMVKFFIAYNYYDYIPCLLGDKMLPKSKSDESYVEFQRAIYFPEQAKKSYFGAITAMHRFPQCPFLLIEIAKVLRARQMPFEADEVLSNLLIYDPLNPVARIMRMLIYSNIAHSQKDFPASELAYARAIAEGEFIIKYCNYNSTIWADFGLIYFSRGMKYLTYLRENNADALKNIQKKDVMENLKKAQEFFLKGMAASPNGKPLGHIFWYIYLIGLLNLFSDSDSLFSQNEHPSYLDKNNELGKAGVNVLKTIGWLRADFSLDEEINSDVFHSAIKTINRVFAKYDNSMLTSSYIPYMKYIFGFVLWDFAPALTPPVCRQVMNWLNGARVDTEKLIKDSISVYQIAADYIPAQKFLERIDDTLKVIKNFATDDYLQKADDTPLDREKLKEMSQIKLMLLEIGRHQLAKPQVQVGQHEKNLTTRRQWQ